MRCHIGLLALKSDHEKYARFRMRVERTVRLELGPNTPLITPFSALQCALRAPSTAPSPPPCPRHMSPRTAARGFPGPPPPRPLGSTRPAGSASQLCVCGEPPHRRARSAFAAHRMVLPDLCGAYRRPPNPQHPHGKHYANYLVTEKSISHGIQPKPPQVRAGPKTAVAARELQRREGHLVAAESWGDRASDRLGRRRCRWLDVGAPRQHPRAVCSGLSCAAPTSPAILFLRRDQDARPDRLQAAREDRPDVWGCCPGRGGRPARVCARAAAVLLHSSAEAHELVVYAKKTLEQPWAAEPVGHSLRASGRCDQPVSP